MVMMMMMMMMDQQLKGQLQIQHKETFFTSNNTKDF
jgi:hypothetical protein